MPACYRLYIRTYKLFDGVPSGWCIGDAVLLHWSCCMLPAHTQSACSGVIDTHVPGCTSWHYKKNPAKKIIIQQSVDRHCSGPWISRSRHGLTCSAIVFHCRALSISIDCNYTNWVLSVWQELLQQGSMGIPWNKDLQGKTLRIIDGWKSSIFNCNSIHLYAKNKHKLLSIVTV